MGKGFVQACTRVPNKYSLVVKSYDQLSAPYYFVSSQQGGIFRSLKLVTTEIASIYDAF